MTSVQSSVSDNAKPTKSEVDQAITETRAPDASEDLLWALSSPEEKTQLLAQKQLDNEVVVALTNTAADQSEFHNLISTAFGDSVDPSRVESLRQSLLDGSFTPPEVTLTDAATLRGATGAYDAQSNTTFLDRAIVGTDIGTATLAEELGHAIDQTINGATVSVPSITSAYPELTP